MLILSYLGVKDLASVAMTSRHWKAIASDDWLWSRFLNRCQVNDPGTDLPKKMVLRQSIPAKVSHMKEILGMTGGENDAMRADFFFNYLHRGLPITPIITDVDFLVDLECKYKNNIPVYIKIVSAILNIRNGNITTLFEYCDRLADNSRRCMYWMPFAQDLQLHLIDKMICDRHVVLLRYFTEAIIYSKGASFSELFQCPEFNPNFLIPPWIDFLDFPKKHLGIITRDKCPFLFVFILQFFTLPMTSESYFLGFHAASSVERKLLIKFDPLKYASMNLPCAIAPQEIVLEQLFLDLEVLVQRPDVDLELTGSDGLTTLELLREMRNSYFIEAAGALDEESLYIFDQVISILEMAKLET